MARLGVLRVRIGSVVGTLYLGTSGFAYKEWKGPFYPEGLKDADMLQFYASRFPAVEINYTFRRFPTEEVLRTWGARTPEGFRFALKANQRITHTRRLRNADADVSDFLSRAQALGHRLGPILFQCPPTLQYNRELIESFLAYLPPMFRCAFEFRHPSWVEARPILRDQGAAWCIAETDDTEADAIPPIEGPFGFLRLRKDAYSDDELRRWSDRIGAAQADGLDVFTYLKHEEGTAAPRHAERLSALAGTEPQARPLRRNGSAMAWNTGQ
jgi:uncharacterized protein YecE (DUF72 family)